MRTDFCHLSHLFFESYSQTDTCLWSSLYARHDENNWRFVFSRGDFFRIFRILLNILDVILRLSCPRIMFGWNKDKAFFMVENFSCCFFFSVNYLLIIHRYFCSRIQVSPPGLDWRASDCRCVTQCWASLQYSLLVPGFCWFRRMCKCDTWCVCQWIYCVTPCTVFRPAWQS